MLSVLDQVAHRVVDMTPGIQIVSSYDTESAPLTILFLVVIAAVEAALSPSNALPKLTYLLCLIDVSTNLVAIEEVGRMDVVAPVVALLPRTDVTNEVVEDRVALMLCNQPVQVIEHVLNT
jgi:hypothetical protein